MRAVHIDYTLRMAVNSLLDQTIQSNVTYDMDGKGRFNAVSDRSIDMRRYKQITCAVMNLSISAGKCGSRNHHNTFDQNSCCSGLSGIGD